MTKPWHQLDAYTFHWPTLSSATAQQRMLAMAEHMTEMTYAERVAYLDKWIPALGNMQAAAKAGIGAFDQHLVLSSLIEWREDNRDRARAAA